MSALENFPTVIQAIVVAFLFAAISVTGIYITRRQLPPHTLQADHEVAGFTFGVVGAFYGVVLAFVIVAVWQRFERTNEKVQAESLAISNLYNLANGFEEPARTQLQNALHDYASHVVNQEWREMAEYRYTQNSTFERRLWSVLVNYHPNDPHRQVFLDKSIDQMADLSDARRLRYVYYSEDLPSVIWIVIYAGCVIVLGFGLFFETRVFRSQAIMSGTFAALIGLTILAISELATPYQGTVVVSDEAFRFALNSMAPVQPLPSQPELRPSDP